jgi:hypothetical protein
MGDIVLNKSFCRKPNNRFKGYEGFLFILPKSNPRRAHIVLSLILFLHKNIDFIVDEQGITIVEDYDKFSSLSIKVSYV